MAADRRNFGKIALGAAAGALAGPQAWADNRRSAEKNATIATIDQFLTAYWSMDVQATMALAADDFVWINMPMQASPQFTIHGRAELFQLMTQHHGGFPEKIEAGEWVFVYALADGGTALHERVDRMKLRGHWIEIPCNAHWEVQSGKVVLWRDYYDLNTYLKGMAAAGIKLSPSAT